MGFWSSATWLYVDIIGRPVSGMDFDFGPILGARLNRSGDVKDGAVDKLPELDAAIEVGAFGGVSFHGLTNPYDTLSLRVDLLHDVGGAHKATLITPSIFRSAPRCRVRPMSAPRPAPNGRAAAMPIIITRSRRRKARSPASRPTMPTAASSTGAST